MATLRKPDKLFWLAGERKQSLAKADGDGGIAYAMHDQEGSGDARNALVGAKLVPDQPTDRHNSKQRAGNVHDRSIGRFQYELSDRSIGCQCNRDPAPE